MRILRERHVKVFETFVARLHERSRVARVAALLGLIYACLRHKPHLLYLNQAGCYRIASAAARIFAIPVVAHVRIFEDVAYLARKKAHHRHLRGIIAISHAIAEEISKCEALSSLSVCVLYDGYAVSGEQPDKNDERDTGSLACVGRIAPIKGQEILLAALRRVNARRNDIRCFIVGSGGQYERKLRNSLEARDVSGIVEWVGFLENPMVILRQVVLLIVPSYREPLGRVIFEAWDCGCVPIAYKGSGGAAEVMQASGGGLLYEEQNAHALAGAIERAFELSSEERRDLIERGRKWTAENCSPDQYRTAMNEVFAHALPNPSSR